LHFCNVILRAFKCVKLIDLICARLRVVEMHTNYSYNKKNVISKVDCDILI